jgi:hypothetical protein
MADWPNYASAAMASFFSCRRPLQSLGKGEWQGLATISAFSVCIFCRELETHSSADILPSNRFEYHPVLV